MFGPADGTSLIEVETSSAGLRVTHYNGRYHSQTVHKAQRIDSYTFDMCWAKYRDPWRRFSLSRSGHLIESNVPGIGRARASVWAREEQVVTNKADALDQKKKTLVDAKEEEEEGEEEQQVCGHQDVVKQEREYSSEEQHADDDANAGSRRTKRSRTAGRKRRRKKQYEERLQDELRDCKSPACSD